MLQADVVDVRDPSATTGPCRRAAHVADGCGGCGWQHVTVDAQRRWKRRMVEESLRRLGRLAGHGRPRPRPCPIAGSAPRCGCSPRRTGRRSAAPGPTTPSPIRSCLVAHPRSRRAHAGTAASAAPRRSSLRIGGRHRRAARDRRSVGARRSRPARGRDGRGRGRRRREIRCALPRRGRRTHGSASRPGRSSRPAPTVPRRWSPRSATPAAMRGRAVALVDLYGGVGLFAAAARRGHGHRAGRVERARPSPTPSTTWPTVGDHRALLGRPVAPVPGRRRRRRPAPRRAGPGRRRRGRGHRRRPAGPGQLRRRPRSVATPGCSPSAGLRAALHRAGRPVPAHAPRRAGVPVRPEAGAMTAERHPPGRSGSEEGLDDDRAAARGERRRPGGVDRPLPPGRAGRGVPPPRRCGVRAGPPAPRRRAPWPRRSCRRSSSASGTTPTASTPTGARCARTCWPSATAARSTCSGPSRPAGAGRRRT